MPIVPVPRSLVGPTRAARLWRAMVLVLSASTLAGCDAVAPTADGLDAGWKEEIGWPVADPNATASSQVTDPGRISGEFSIELYGGECFTTWAMEGTRTDCRECDYAFSVELDPIEDRCGYGRWDGQVHVANGYLYFNYNRSAAVELTGNVLHWDSRDDYGDEPYGYEDYYYGYSSVAYYGTATLYAR